MNELIKFDFVKRIKEQLNVTTTDEKGFSLPIKGTKRAAVYDFINPEQVTIQPKEIKIVKTGIKAYFPNDIALLLLNRSSNAKKKGLVLMNGVGLIDADYVDNEDNEGEIGFMFMNITEEPVTINEGDKLGQGMFVKYFDTSDYNSSNVSDRTGGWGSTGI